MSTFERNVYFPNSLYAVFLVASFSVLIGSRLAATEKKERGEQERKVMGTVEVAANGPLRERAEAIRAWWINTLLLPSECGENQAQAVAHSISHRSCCAVRVT